MSLLGSVAGLKNSNASSRSALLLLEGDASSAADMVSVTAGILGICGILVGSRSSNEESATTLGVE